MANLPNKIKNFNILVEYGVGANSLAGVASEIEMPVIKFKTENHTAAGLDGEIAIETGMEELTTKITLSSYEPAVFRAAGFGNNGTNVGIIARGLLKRGTQEAALNVVMRGIVTEINLGTWKKGDDTTQSFSMSLTFLSIVQDAEELCYIDIPNSVRRISGSDAMKNARSILLL